MIATLLTLSSSSTHATFAMAASLEMSLRVRSMTELGPCLFFLSIACAILFGFGDVTRLRSHSSPSTSKSEVLPSPFEWSFGFLIDRSTPASASHLISWSSFDLSFWSKSSTLIEPRSERDASALPIVR